MPLKWRQIDHLSEGIVTIPLNLFSVDKVVSQQQMDVNLLILELSEISLLKELVSLLHSLKLIAIAQYEELLIYVAVIKDILDVLHQKLIIGQLLIQTLSVIDTIPIQKNLVRCSLIRLPSAFTIIYI